MFIFSKFHTSCLLCLADTVIIPLNIWNITKCDCHRISYFIGNSNTVQTGGKLARICRRNKQDRNWKGYKIFQRNIQHIKQLLCGHIISPKPMTQYVPCSIQIRSLIRIKQKNKQVVQKQKNKHKDHHEPNFTVFDLTEFKCSKADCKQSQQHPGIISDHTCEREQQEKCQLGCSCHFVYHAVAVQII